MYEIKKIDFNFSSFNFTEGELEDSDNSYQDPLRLDTMLIN